MVYRKVSLIRNKLLIKNKVMKQLDLVNYEVKWNFFGTSVVLLRCPFVPEIIYGRAPWVFLHQ
jgi:hypothetical protein